MQICVSSETIFQVSFNQLLQIVLSNFHNVSVIHTSCNVKINNILLLGIFHFLQMTRDRLQNVFFLY